MNDTPRVAAVAADRATVLRILRRRQVETQTGLARSTLYQLIAEGSFPMPIHLGPRAVAWFAIQGGVMTKPARSALSRSQYGPWSVHFFQRHPSDDPTRAVPALEFLRACPTKVEAMIVAVVRAVADAPPPTFSGGGKWEAMHGEMSGFYEVRVDGPKRRHYRLFCLLERQGASLGLGGPSVVLIAGKDKPFMTVLSAADYAEVKALGAEYRKRIPRSVMP